jgi:hypothetical protein
MNVSGKHVVESVRRDAQGRNIAFQLRGGDVIDYREAIELALSGRLQNVNAFRSKDGEYHLRSNADGDPDNNLDHLPQF